MQISSTTLNNVAAILRRAPCASRPAASSVMAARNFSAYRPLYSTNGQTKSTTSHRQLHWIQSRLANTSSGIYAPSSIAIDRHSSSKHEPRGNHTVFEDSDHLPALPVPELERTLERLKESISPVAMNSAEFVHALQLIDEFGRMGGPKLDLLLRAKAEQTKNWLSHDWWVNDTYLKSRNPLVINSNPSMIYPHLPFEVDNQRALISTISHIISGIIEFKHSLMSGYNPEATSADNECRLDPNLCYNQYKNIFGATRMPGEHIDSIRVNQWVEGEPFNVVISYRGKFFELQLKEIEDEKERIEKVSSILEQFIGLPAIDDQHGAGVLTATNRSDWAKAFTLMDPDSMEAIQQAQFVVCIDTIPERKPEDEFASSLLTAPPGSEQHSAALCRQVLHGDSANVGNRWFDKSLQLIVVADDKAERLLGAGINYEHTFAEGTVVAKLIEYSYDKAVQKQRESSAKANLFAKQQVSSQGPPAVFRQLRMFSNNEDGISERLTEAEKTFASQVSQFDLSFLDYKEYGSNAIKSWHFSPDSWFQVALQSAYYNVHKRLGPCYESASTRRFAYGRTETIRSLTKDVAHFCYEPKFETMQAAIQSHKAYALSAVNGEAIDRVLMGYRLAFNEVRANAWSWGLSPGSTDSQSGAGPGLMDEYFSEDEMNTISAFFNNELINRSTRFALSTSQVSSVHPNICMSYGPILVDGYGCCYNITGQQIVAGIAANSSMQSFSCEVHKLNEGIRDSLNRMRDIVEEQRSKSKQ